MVLLRGIGIAKKGLGKVLGRDKTEAIKSFKPGTKFKGQQTVSEVQLGASKAAKDAAQFEFKQALKKFGKKKTKNEK